MQKQLLVCLYKFLTDALNLCEGFDNYIFLALASVKHRKASVTCENELAKFITLQYTNYHFLALASVKHRRRVSIVRIS